MKQENYNEMIHRMISAFEEDGYTNFQLKTNFKDTGFSDKKIRLCLKELELEGKVENCTSNGFMSKYKLNEVLDCPGFMFNKKLKAYDKWYLLKLLEVIDEEVLSQKQIARLTDVDVKNLPALWSRLKERCEKDPREFIKETKNIRLEAANNLIKTPLGYQLDTNPKKTDVSCLCQYCETTDPNNFSKGSRITCKKCKEERRRVSYISNFSDMLYKNSLKGYKQRPNIKGEYNLDVEIIEDQLDKQANRCYYTNIEFNKENYLPSIDRIDSNKGYTKDNIVICLQKINVMKSDLSLNEFKNLISLIYKNINNI